MQTLQVNLHINDYSLRTLRYVIMNKSALDAHSLLKDPRSSLFAPASELHCTVTPPQSSISTQLCGK